jgi:hypothetical protein
MSFTFISHQNTDSTKIQKLPLQTCYQTTHLFFIFSPKTWKISTPQLAIVIIIINILHGHPMLSMEDLTTHQPKNWFGYCQVMHHRWVKT